MREGEMRLEVKAVVQHSTFYQFVLEHEHPGFVFGIPDVLQYPLHLIETIIVPEFGTHLIEPKFAESDFPFQHIRPKTVVVSLYQ